MYLSVCLCNYKYMWIFMKPFICHYFKMSKNSFSWCPFRLIIIIIFVYIIISWLCLTRSMCFVCVCNECLFVQSWSGVCLNQEPLRQIWKKTPGNRSRISCWRPSAAPHRTTEMMMMMMKMRTNVFISTTSQQTAHLWSISRSSEELLTRNATFTLFYKIYNHTTFVISTLVTIYYIKPLIRECFTVCLCSSGLLQGDLIICKTKQRTCKE